MTAPTTPSCPELCGRSAIVAGAATGIGSAIATALAAQSIRVAVADIDRAAAQATAAAIGGGAVGIGVDVRSRDPVEAAWQAAEATLGPVDILAANAGVLTMRRAVDLTDADWDFNFAVNARGVFLTNQIAARACSRARSSGRRNCAACPRNASSPITSRRRRWDVSRNPRTWPASWSSFARTRRDS